MIKRFHEAPLDIFDKVQKVTEGDYALVHLFKDNPDYFEKFKLAIKKGREVILDNSLFELRETFDSEEYVHWIKELEPTYAIVPDSWKNGEETARMFFEFLNKYPKETLPCKLIGVAQGNTLEEVAACYKAIEPYCDKIAFNFDFSSYSELPIKGSPLRLRMSIGRYKMLNDLYNKGIINTEKPHHLLGTGVPQECLWYNKNWTWIDSVDTCNPVIEGIYGVMYDEKLPGMLTKNHTKVCDIIHRPTSKEEEKRVMFNIKQMKYYCE